MTNLNELIERRKQINEDIEKTSKYIKRMKAIVHEMIEKHEFYLAELNSGILKSMNEELKIMLEQNVTLKEAEAIIEAQKEQAA